MIFGTTTVGVTQTDLAADTRRGSRYTAPEEALLAKLTAHIDGNGAGSGSQVLKAVIYDATNALVATSNEVTIADGQAAAWVDFTFATPPKLTAQNYWIALHAGETTNSARVYGSSSGESVADTYADGAAAAGAWTTAAAGLSIFATYFFAWEPSLDEDDYYYARLPWLEAQGKFGETAPAGVPLAVTCEWHGLKFDAETVAFAIARTDGPLAEYVGERIKVTLDTGIDPVSSVLTYVHREAAIDSDLSLSRRAFANLAPLATEELEVVVEAMSEALL